MKPSDELRELTNVDVVVLSVVALSSTHLPSTTRQLDNDWYYRLQRWAPVMLTGVT